MRILRAVTLGFLLATSTVSIPKVARAQDNTALQTYGQRLDERSMRAIAPLLEEARTNFSELHQIRRKNEQTCLDREKKLQKNA